jgi:hypothetical protein
VFHFTNYFRYPSAGAVSVKLAWDQGKEDGVDNESGGSEDVLNLSTVSSTGNTQSNSNMLGGSSDMLGSISLEKSSTEDLGAGSTNMLGGDKLKLPKIKAGKKAVVKLTKKEKAKSKSVNF